MLRALPMFPERCFLSLPLLVAVLLSGCSSQPRSTYPVLPRVLESDSQIGCTGFDDELLKANAIRDEIYREHGDMIRAASLSVVTEIAADPLFGPLSGLLRGAAASRAAARYMEAADAAGARMEQMLTYKERDACPSTPTADPQVTEPEILQKLRGLAAQLDSEVIDEGQYRADRQSVLGALR